LVCLFSNVFWISFWISFQISFGLSLFKCVLDFFWISFQISFGSSLFKCVLDFFWISFQISFGLSLFKCVLDFFWISLQISFGLSLFKCVNIVLQPACECNIGFPFLNFNCVVCLFVTCKQETIVSEISKNFTEYPFCEPYFRIRTVSYLFVPSFLCNLKIYNSKLNEEIALVKSTWTYS